MAPDCHPEEAVGETGEIRAIPDKDSSGKEPVPDGRGGESGYQLDQQVVGCGWIRSQTGKSCEFGGEKLPFPGDKAECPFPVAVVSHSGDSGCLCEGSDSPGGDETGSPFYHPGRGNGVPKPEPRQSVELGERTGNQSPSIADDG